MADPIYDRGMSIRYDMFGVEATDAQMRNVDDFTRDLQDIVTRYCFGEVWGREGLTRNVRSMLTLAILIALGREAEIKIHVRGAIANGVSKEELREVFLHAAIYAGIPAAVGAFRSAIDTFAEIDRGEEVADPTRAD